MERGEPECVGVLEVLVDITGWQGLFWIDAGVAIVCMVLTAATVAESRDESRPPTISPRSWTER